MKQISISQRITEVLSVALMLMLCCGCGSGSGSSSARQFLSGGSTFGYPLYSTMFAQYYHIDSVQTNYQSIGSGGGIKGLMNQQFDFGASDAFLTDKQMAQFTAPVVHIPTCVGAVVLTYNLPGNPELNLSPDVVAGIFMRTITRWNAPKIAADNPGITLPNEAITPVHRSDGSGTTFIFTDYLSKVSSNWKSEIGRAVSVNWPNEELGGKGSEGVSGIIKQTPGSIGYVELVFALQNNMGYARVKNAAGNWIKATLETAGLSANIDLPADARVSITNSDVAQAYPISGFTWILLYKEQNYNGRSLAKATNLLKELWWVIHDGQKICTPLNYAPLSPKAVTVAENILKSVTYNGKPILH